MLDAMLNAVGKRWTLTALEDASRRFEAAGMAFEARAYAAEGLGHIGVMTAEGQAKLETLIVNPFVLDAPILSCDRVCGMGQVMLMAEMYDSLLGDSFRTEALRLAAGPEEAAAGEKKAYWYTSLVVPPWLNLRGGPESQARLEAQALGFVEAYLDAAHRAEPCDLARKRRKAAVYSEGLLTHGGPATDPVKAAMGEAFTAELFRRTLFGNGAPEP